MSTSKLSAALLLAAALSAAALAQETRPAALPTGEWHGEGAFTIHTWDKSDDEANRKPDVYEHGRYKTRLKIEATRIGDRDGYRLEILSERGKTKSLDGDRTHLVLVLDRRRAYDGETGPIEYAAVEKGLTLDASPLDVSKNEEHFPVVTWIPHAESPTLHLTYDRQVPDVGGFFDVITFHGDTIRKSGVLALDDGAVQWTEHLKRK